MSFSGFIGDADSPRFLIEQALHEFGRLDQSHVLTFPEGDPDAVTITHKDMRSLEPEGWLSDNIVDFYIKYLQGILPPELKDRCYFFNSFFMTKLLPETHSLSTDTSQGKVAYERVRKWTDKVDLFEKECIFIPVIRSLHWSLVIISHLNSLSKPSEEHKVSPCIYHLDSLEGKHGSFESQIRSYILQAWIDRYHVANGDQLLALGQMKYEQIKVPQQANNYDCGIYMLLNVQSILHDPTFTSPCGRPHGHDFPYKHERENIKIIISELSGLSHLQLTIRQKSHEIFSWLKDSEERDKDVNNSGHEATIGDIEVDNGRQHGVEIEHAAYQFFNKIEAGNELQGANINHAESKDDQLHGANINHAKRKAEDSALNSQPQQGVWFKHADCEGTAQISLKKFLHSRGGVTEDATYQTTGEIPSDNHEDEQLPCTRLSKPLGRNWSKEETLVLLNCIAEGGCFYKRNGAVICWNMISQEIQRQVGTNRTHDQCRYRYDTLLKAYKTMKDYCIATSKAFSKVVGEERRKLKLATVLDEQWYMAIDRIEIHRHKASDQFDGLTAVVVDDEPLSSSLQVLSPTTSTQEDVSPNPVDIHDNSLVCSKYICAEEEQFGNKGKGAASPKYRGVPKQRGERGLLETWERNKRSRISLNSAFFLSTKDWEALRDDQDVVGHVELLWAY